MRKRKIETYFRAAKKKENSSGKDGEEKKGNI